MIAALMMGAALAAPPKVLDLKLSGPDGVVFVDQRFELPAEPGEYRAEVGGVPHLARITADMRHDVVAVDAVIYELKGRKLKPKEVAHPRLLIYEDFPGELVMTSPLPRDYEGGDAVELSWTLEANWSVASPPKEPAAPAEEPPAPEQPSSEQEDAPAVEQPPAAEQPSDPEQAP